MIQRCIFFGLLNFALSSFIISQTPLDSLKISAASGDAEAQNYLGVCFEHGDGINKDLKQAVVWFQKSAAQGNLDAQCNLGNCYFYGFGTDVNGKAAFYWFMKSAEKGFAKAQYNLGICYEHGEGVEKILI